MTTSPRQIDLDRQIDAARKRGDLAEVARLRFQGPWWEGNEFLTGRRSGGTAGLRDGLSRPGSSGRILSQPARSRVTPAFEYEAKLEPPTEVTMTWKLRRRLQEEAAQTGETRETGGFLFGRIEPHILGRTTRAQIHDFSAGCPLFRERTADHLRFTDAAVAEALGNRAFLGSWHTHGSRGAFGPSDTDRNAWGGMADQVSWRSGRAPGIVGLIVAADEGKSWIAPAMQLRAWFTPPLRYDVPPDEREPKPIAIREVD